MEYISNPIKTDLITAYQKHFSTLPKLLVRSSGRMELLGNHTDHQGGKVLVAAINLFLYAACSPRTDTFINFISEGFEPVTIDLNDLSIHPEEFSTTASLLRGIAARLSALNKRIGGMNIYVKTEVPPGSGVSSSAGFEMLIVEAFNQLFNQGDIDPLTRAMVGQYAENHYFNKPSGLLDQMGVSLGGINYINFYSTNPLVYQTMDFPFLNLRFMLINTGGSHANLTDHYQNIRLEMEQVAQSFGKTRLSDVDPSLWERTPPHTSFIGTSASSSIPLLS
jgi:galactokinase